MLEGLFHPPHGPTQLLLEHLLQKIANFVGARLARHHYNQLLGKFTGNRLESFSSAVEFFILEALSRVSHERNCYVFCHHGLITKLGCKQNQFDSKAGTTARAIETLMGQYFD